MKIKTMNTMKNKFFKHSCLRPNMNKKAISIAIFVLVISSLLLSIISLTFFYIKNNKIDTTIKVFNEMDKVYFKELLTNFYLQDIFDKAVEGVEVGGSKQVFIDNFNKELEDYKDKNERYPIQGLEFIGKQVLPENIELSNEKLVLKLRLTITKSYVSKDESGSFTYHYEKEFQKVFK